MKKSKVTLEITVDTSEGEAVYNDIYEFMRVCRLQDFTVKIDAITPEEKILEIRDTLIELNRRWNERGPHATWDSPVIDMCILELDKLVNG